MERISYLLVSVQRSLFPHLREEVGELTEKERRFVLVLEVVQIEKHVRNHHWLGRKPKDRKPLARSFVAKAFYNMPTTGALRERLIRDKTFRRLCGWEFKYQVPSESTFSRAFDKFAQSGLADKVHEALVKEYVGDEVVWHVSRDSTAIEAREKPTKKIKAAAPKVNGKRGRPKKGELRPVPEKKRLEKQREWSLQECLADLPRACDVGTKKDSKGHKMSWPGYKFNVDVADGGIPILGIG
ncbi:MAG: transposase [Armatimonadota bacterium]